jgi:Putative rhamnosyl transferase
MMTTLPTQNGCREKSGDTTTVMKANRSGRQDRLKKTNTGGIPASSPLTRLIYCLLWVGSAKVFHDIRTTVTLITGHPIGWKLEPASIPASRYLRSVTFDTAPTYRSSHALDIMQVVRTRFMQRQPHLVALGKSRLELFKTFCLPTMLKQSLQDFAWLVYTDPELHPSILNELQDVLKPHPNFYLILSNDNELTLADLIQAARDNPGMVLTGNLESLTRSYQSHAESQASVVLYIETGLDADDGLQKDTLSEIQKHAVAETYVWNSPTQRSGSYHWFILCVGNHYEWHNVDLFLGNTKDFRGVIYEQHNPRRCVTPGLTMVNSLTAPHHPEAVKTSIFDHAPFPYNEIVVNHWRLNEKYPNCRLHGANEFEPCWKQINNNDKTHTAIRARTITSTGMKDVMSATADEQIKSDALWDVLASDFGIRVGNVKKASKSLYANRVKTVTELMKGRCQKGHSCLDQTEKDLNVLLQQLKH